MSWRKCSNAAQHSWTSEGMGGLRENPGVWSAGGTAMKFASRCTHCGLRRVETTAGPQERARGQRDRTEYEWPGTRAVTGHSRESL